MDTNLQQIDSTPPVNHNQTTLHNSQPAPMEILEMERSKRSRIGEEEMNEEPESSEDKGIEDALKESAKLQLHQICAANKWKAPIFECCKEEGPSHMKMFTFKVIVEPIESSRTLLETYGFPQLKKKAAAESAAEGAIWYLNSQGYFPNKKRNKQADTHLKLQTISATNHSEASSGSMDTNSQMDINHNQSVHESQGPTEILEMECPKGPRIGEKETNEHVIEPESESEEDKGKDGIPNKNAKLQLHQICVANKWKAPIFECCKDEGPSHMKMFTFKVTVETIEMSNRLFETYGVPQLKKKAAAESVAKGAIWYLKSHGYFPNKKGNKKAGIQ
ncbi:hypothetical protein ACFE04_012339 [Oxalis oulophora]